MIEPVKFVESVYQNFNYFQPKTQQDAQEFLTVFLDKLATEIANHLNLPGFIDTLFKGQYTYQNQCLQCDLESENVDFFIQLNLSITELNVEDEKYFTDEEKFLLDDKGSLKKLMSWMNYARNGAAANLRLSIYDCLKYFVGNQIIERNCERCQEIVKHDVKIKLDSLPDYLILSFKRFKYNYWSSKVSDQVYLAKSLEMKIIDQSIEEDSQYELTAVIEHYGFVFRGHYKMYLNNHGEWWLLDDKTIKKVDFSTVFNSQAYIALYTRKRHLSQSCQYKFSSPDPKPTQEIIIQKKSPETHETIYPDLKPKRNAQEEIKLPRNPS